jgi:hypothetical protein
MKTNTSSTTSAPTSTTATSRSGSARQQTQTPRQGLPSRPDHQRQQQPEAEAEAALPPIDLRKRRTRRSFSTRQVLDLLQAEAPEFFGLAEVVGQWVWITFRDKQPREVTARLAEFGFHWNNQRGSWQHPCGQLRPGTQHDPRQKYQTYFPADLRAA